MKIIDEKGRLFKTINVVDLLILIVALFVIGGIGYKLFAPAVTDAVAPQVKMTTVMRVRGATPFLLAEVNRTVLEGQKLVSGNAYVDASIEKVTMEPYVIQATTADGKIVNAVDPSKKDIVLIIVSKVSKDTPAPKIGNQEVRAGRTFILKTKAFETIANIDSVSFE